MRQLLRQLRGTAALPWELRRALIRSALLISSGFSQSRWPFALALAESFSAFFHRWRLPVALAFNVECCEC